MPDNKKSSERVLSGEDFEIWIKSRGISTYDAAEWLGVSRATLRYYRRNGLNRAQALAISALDRGLKPWTPTEDDRQRAKAANDRPDADQPAAGEDPAGDVGETDPGEA